MCPAIDIAPVQVCPEQYGVDTPVYEIDCRLMTGAQAILVSGNKSTLDVIFS
jgi:hypothetical protein